MFEHSYIPQPHQIVLSTALRGHTLGNGVNPLILAKLYKASLDSFKEPVNERDILTSVLRGDLGNLSTATDMKTGVYVQLAQIPGQSACSITIGRKWAMEGLNKTLGNYSTTYW
jgi:hypothetical protein